MSERLRRITLFTKAALFTIGIHGILVAALFAGGWWPFLEDKVEIRSVKPIQAQVISEKEVQKQVQARKKKVEDKQQLVQDIENLKVKQELEEKKLKEIEIKKKEEVKKQKELEVKKKVEQEKRVKEKQVKERRAKEKKKKAEQAKKKKEDEKRQKEAEKQQKEDEVRKKLEEAQQKQVEEKQRKIEETQRQIEEETQRQIEKVRREDAERRLAEESVQRQIDGQLNATVRANALSAMSAFANRINAKFKRTWVRPANSAVGLIAVIRVNVSPRGDVLAVSVVKSSGDLFFDRSAEIAVKKSSPLPLPPEPDFYEHLKVLNLEFNPDNY